MIPIYPYRTREVRDLAWACFSPPLLHTSKLAGVRDRVADCGLVLTPARRHWLAKMDQDASALLEHLTQQRSHRLGVYFEHLWHFFLAQDPAIELLGHNLAIHDRGQTLGEFDCLYFCHERQRHFHLELAVKFFLSHRPGTVAAPVSDWRDWLGPNTKDRLDLKVAHLMKQQIKLGEHPLARAQLERLGISELEKEVVMKGYLFQSVADPVPAPRAFNSQCKLQQWLRVDQLAGYLDSLDARQYMVLAKSHWLASARADGSVDACGPQQLASAVQSHFEYGSRSFGSRHSGSRYSGNRHSGRSSSDTRPLLVAALDDTGAESRRFFVTARDWPYGDDAN